MYIVNTGNQSLDNIIGGGIPIGSLTVLYEDCLSHFYTHFQKTYLAEGIVRQQICLIIDAEHLRNRDHWIKFLPAVAEIKVTEEETK